VSNAHDSVRQKVDALLSELVGNRTARLREPDAQQTRETFAQVLSADHSPEVARELAFHLVDWASDAAFLLAAQLFPERFTPGELITGVDMLLIHAPNHLAAAAKLAGHSVADIFEVGALDQAGQDT
jgi:hypothetical protein